MPDVFVPGVNSRFNTQGIIDDLMRVERVPKDRAEKNVERYQDQRTFWQEINRRTTTLRNSARQLFSFQNPFSDRVVNSTDSAVLTGTAVREAMEQERSFTVRQVAQADRFLSNPLDQNFRVDGGTYTFSIGSEEISFDYRGGSLRDFTEALNRRGRDMLQASLVAVRPGTTSLLIESRVTGEENRLDFSGAALALGERTGMVGRANDSRVNFTDGVVNVQAGASAEIPVNFQPPSAGNWLLRFETSTNVRPEEAQVVPQPPPGPSIPPAGSVSYGGIVVENNANSVPLPAWNPPEQPQRVDNMGVLSVTFSDGSSARLPPISDSQGFNTHQYELGALAQGKTIASINLINDNTHRDVNVRNVQILDPGALGGVKPLNPVSTAQDAIVVMDGIEIQRSGNEIDDLLPGVTITARRVSDRPVSLTVAPDREAIKDAIISFVGNYNRLMAEVNVLTRRDPQIIEELTYLTAEEREGLKDRLGAFSGDSTLNQLRNSLIRITGAPYPTSAERELTLLAHIGVGTDVRLGGASGGFDAARLRGYLEIDERVLDNVIETRLTAVRELFGSDSSGSRIIDSGIAFDTDTLTRAFTETGGIFAVRTGTIDSQIDRENTRIQTLDRQLTQREADLRRQYSQMEESFRRMDQMSTSLDRFNQQSSNNSR